MVGPEQMFSGKPGLLDRPPALLPSETRGRLNHSIPSRGILPETVWEARSSMAPVNEQGSRFRDETSLLGDPLIWSQSQPSTRYQNTVGHPFVSEGSYRQEEVAELKDPVGDFIGTVMSVIHSKLVKMMNGKDEIEQQDLLDGLISIIGRAGRGTEMHTSTSHQGVRNDRSSLLGPPPPSFQDSILDKYVTHSDSPQLLRKMLPALHKKLLEIEPNRSGLLGDHPLFRSSEMKELMKQYARRVTDHMIDSSQFGLLGEHPLADQTNIIMKDRFENASNNSVLLGNHSSEREGRQSGLLGSHPLECSSSGPDKPYSYGLLGDRPEVFDNGGLLRKEPLYSDVGKSFDIRDRNQGLLGSHPLAREKSLAVKATGLLGDGPGRNSAPETKIQHSGLLGDHPFNEPTSHFISDNVRPSLLGAIPGLDSVERSPSDAIHYHIQAARKKKPLIDIPGHISSNTYASSSHDYPGLLGEEPLRKRARVLLPPHEVNSGRPYSQQPSLLGDYPALPFQRPPFMMHSLPTRTSEYRPKQRIRSRNQGRTDSEHSKRGHETTSEQKRSSKTGHKKDDDWKTKSSRHRLETSESDTGSVDDYSSDNSSVNEFEDRSTVKRDYDSDGGRKYSDYSEESD